MVDDQEVAPTRAYVETLKAEIEDLRLKETGLKIAMTKIAAYEKRIAELEGIPPVQHVAGGKAEELAEINAALKAINDTCAALQYDDRGRYGVETIEPLRNVAKLINKLVFQQCTVRAAAFEKAARIADEYSAADTHLKDLARKDKDATGVFVHAAEAATGKAIASAIRAALKSEGAE